MKNRIILFVLAICITTASLYGQQTSSASHLPVMDLNNPIVSAMPSNVDVTPMGAPAIVSLYRYLRVQMDFSRIYLFLITHKPDWELWV